MTAASFRTAVRTRRPGQGALVLGATILASTTVFIDTAVMTIALPVLQREFQAGLAEIQWIAETYLLTLTALMLTGGALGDQFGRRLIFLAGVILFALASLWCGLSNSVGELMASRAAQGIAGALLIPGGLAILTHFFPPAERGRAIGIWSAFTSISVAFAPVLGGWMIDSLSWRWIFFINVPIGLVVVVLTFIGVPESRDETHHGYVDVKGALLATGGLGTLVFALIEWARWGPTHWLVLTCLVLGIGLSAGFIYHEARTRKPMLPLGLFRSRTFSGMNVATLLLYAGLSIILFFMPIHLIHVMHYSAFEAGAVMLPFILMLALLSHLAGWLADRYGARLLVTIGPVLSGIGFLMLGWPDLEDTSWHAYVPGMMVTGLGIAATITPLTTAVMGSVPSAKAGIASAINNAVSRLAFLLAVAVMGAVALLTFKAGLGADMTALLGSEVAKMGEATAPEGLANRAQVQLAVDLAALETFRVMTACACGLSVAAAIVSWFSIDPHDHPSRNPDNPVEFFPG